MQEPEETRVQSLSQEDLLEEGMGTHANILAWRIPGKVEPDGLSSLGSHRVGHDWSDLAAAAASGSVVKQETQIWSLSQEDLLEEEMATHSSILAWEISRTEESGWLQSMGLQKSDTN